MKKNKVLIIGPNFKNKGGISRVSQKYKDNGLFDDKIQFLSSYCDGNIFDHLVEFLVCIFKLLYSILTNGNLKIIHVTAATHGSFLRKSIIILLSKLFGKKTVIHIRGGGFNIFYDNNSSFTKKAISFILNQTDIVLVLSERWKEFIGNITSNKNLKILYNPVVIRDINPESTNENIINVLFMGRIGERKGAYDIIEAAKHIKNENIKIDLYGDGENNKFKKLIKEQNLENIISINDWITGEQVDKAYTNAAIFILPTYREGLPNSVIEAISYGLPVISTPVDGIPEIVEDEVNGFLIQPGDYKALAEKIDLLADSKELREKMGKESYRIAKEKFDIKIILKQMRNLYDEMLNQL